MESLAPSSAARRVSRCPTPYLDVFTIHSRRLLPKSREEIAAGEREQRLHEQLGSVDPAGAASDSAEEAAARLEVLAASVRLLLEPIHLPDLSHTGVAAEAADKARGEDAPLFYPTGAKSANIREFIRETIDKHQQQRGAASTADLVHDAPRVPLAASASAPALSSAPKVKSKSRAASKRKAEAYSPVRVAMSSPSALLDRDLTRQAKDVVAMLRANASKINELIAK